MNVKEGDKVLYSKYGGTEIKYDGKEYLIMSESDIPGNHRLIPKQPEDRKHGKRNSVRCRRNVRS